MVWLVALLVGCSVLTSCSEQKKRTRKAAVKVETFSVGSNASGKTKDYVGTIEEKTGATLSFELGGNITSIRVDEGDRVSKGQVLATINPTTLNETHRGALSTLKQAQDAYRRFQPLHKAGTISDIKWVEIESKLEQAKAAEAIARQQLTHQHQGTLQRGGSLEASRHGHVRAAGTAGSEDSRREGSER